MYSPYPSQKSAAAIVAAVVSSFYPESTLDYLECDPQGFDLIFSSSIELNEGLFQVLQEEIRRRKTHISLRSFSMIPSVLKGYIAETKKQFGPQSYLFQSTLVDVLEISSFCCLIDGPHEESSEKIGELVLTAFSCTQKKKKYVWHIRGAAFVQKKGVKEGKAAQKKEWELDLRSHLEQKKIASFTEEGMIVLPEGVKQWKELENILSFGSDKWIQTSLFPLASLRSDEELLPRLLERSKRLQENRVDLYDCMEMVSFSRSKQYRMPLGFVLQQHALVRYGAFSLEREIEKIVMLFRGHNLPLSFTCRARSESMLEGLCSLVRVYDQPTYAELGPYESIVLHSRGIPLSAFVIDWSKRQTMISIPAVSFERWISFWN